MIDSRIRDKLEVETSDKEPWFAAFENRYMRGTQHKFQHMAARSYLRPRDIISFCNCALDAAKKRVRTGGGPDSIINEDMTQARKAYSAYIF